jgi:hypothetical protein
MQLRALIETDGLAPEDLIWPAGASPAEAIRADAALAFPTAVAVEPTAFQPAASPPPEWLRELKEALAAGGDLVDLPPPDAKSWLADVGRAEQKSRQGEHK